MAASRPRRLQTDAIVHSFTPRWPLPAAAAAAQSDTRWYSCCMVYCLSVRPYFLRFPKSLDWIPQSHSLLIVSWRLVPSTAGLPVTRSHCIGLRLRPHLPHAHYLLYCPSLCIFLLLLVYVICGTRKLRRHPVSFPAHVKLCCHIES